MIREILISTLVGAIRQKRSVELNSCFMVKPSKKHSLATFCTTDNCQNILKMLSRKVS